MEAAANGRRPPTGCHYSFTPILLLSRALGVFPFRRARGKEERWAVYEVSRPIRAYSILFILASSVMLLFYYGAANSIFAALVKDGHDMGKSLFVNKIEYLICLLNSLGNLLFSIGCGDRVRNVFVTLSKIDAMLIMPTSPYKALRPRHGFLRRIAHLQVAFVIAFSSIRIVTSHMSFNAAATFYTVVIPINLVRVGTFLVEQQLVHLSFMMRERFRLINAAIERILISPELVRFSWTAVACRHRLGLVADNGRSAARGLAEAIETLRLAHAQLAREIASTTRAFSFSILADVLQLFFDFIAGGYFLLNVADGDGVIKTASIAGLWVTNSWIRIALLSWVTGDTSQKAKMAGSLVVKAFQRKMDPDMREELNIFVAQMGQTDTKFSVFGLFTLDMTLSQALTQAATSYLLVLAQFQSQ